MLTPRSTSPPQSVVVALAAAPRAAARRARTRARAVCACRESELSSSENMPPWRRPMLIQCPPRAGRCNEHARPGILGGGSRTATLMRCAKAASGTTLIRAGLRLGHRAPRSGPAPHEHCTEDTGSSGRHPPWPLPVGRCPRPRSPYTVRRSPHTVAAAFETPPFASGWHLDPAWVQRAPLSPGRPSPPPGECPPLEEALLSASWFAPWKPARSARRPSRPRQPG
jgi:hypothetical protein